MRARNLRVANVAGGVDPDEVKLNRSQNAFNASSKIDSENLTRKAKTESLFPRMWWAKSRSCDRPTQPGGYTYEAS